MTIGGGPLSAGPIGGQTDGGSTRTAFVTASSPLGAAALRANLIPVASVQAASPLGAAKLLVQAVALVQVSASSPLGACTAVGSVIRYELRGEVRENGVLINRRVRAYLRSTGALVAEADTVVGQFVLNCGVSAQEFYLTPIDLDNAATDWLPPTANRVMSVLALDAA